MAVGLAVLTLAGFEFDTHNRAGEIAEAVCGLWLVASPFVLGYASTGTLRHWHFALGALVTLLAVLALVQEWTPGADAKTKPGH